MEHVGWNARGLPVASHCPVHSPRVPVFAVMLRIFPPWGKIAFFYILVEEALLLHTKYGMFSRTTGASFCLRLEWWASRQILNIIGRAVTSWSMGDGTHVNILTLTNFCC